MAAGITSVDFDHEEYLGHTIDAIAREKAGVIKAGTVAVLGANPPAVQDVVRQQCRTVHAGFVYAPDGVRAQATVEVIVEHDLGRRPDRVEGHPGRR